MINALRVTFTLLTAPYLVAAQQPQEQQRLFPPQRSLQLGLAGVVEDGHSSRRISVFFNASERWVPGVTATFGLIDIVEPELRWFPNRRTSPFFLSTSMIYRDFGPNCFGGSFALGLESSLYQWLSASASFGWESVFAGGPADGPHWFRIQASLAIVLPFAVDN
jgi:hypothetical protein